MEDQTRAKDQLKELFGRIRELKKDNHELYQISEKQQYIIDSLRSELQEIKKITEAEVSEVSTQKGRCNQDTKPCLQL